MSRAALSMLVGALVLCRSAGAITPSLADGNGIHVETVAQIDARQLAVRVSTEALQHPVDVRILLPDDYDAQADRAYPVLYLFHGTSGRASDWVNAGRAEETTAGLPLIVVMPDAGFDGDGGGWFADWFNGGAFGPPKWETFHVSQLLPWIDANLRTIPKRSGRAIAGLSQGGFGALSYAARHPELFTSVASFSGGCEIDRDEEAKGTATAIIQYTTSVLSGADKDAIFGPRETQELNWQAHDPATLVTNLRGMQIALWTGNGEAGPLDVGTPDPGATSIEKITYAATKLFRGHLQDAHIPHLYRDYGAGTHTFAYWARDLEEYVGPLMRRFAHPPGRKNVVGYATVADSWEQWGWHVEVERPEAAFAHLRQARRTGFALTGTGRAVVRTPAVYAPGASLRVTVRGRAGTTMRDLTADRKGSLRVRVPLSGDGTPGTTRVAIVPR